MLLLVPSESMWVVGISISVVVTLVTWVLSNLARRRRPFATVDRVGWPERLVFVLVPSVTAFALPVEELPRDMDLIGWELRVYSLLLVGLTMLVAFGITYARSYSGFMALWPWLRRQLLMSFLAAGSALGRTIPLLLGVIGLFFFTAELWQTLGRLASWAFLLVMMLFIALSWAFLHSRRQLDLDALATFDNPGEIVEQLKDTPLANLPVADTPVRCPLNKYQERTLRLVATISRLTVAGVIGSAVFVFFLVLGMMTVNGEVVKAWSTSDPTLIWQWRTTRHVYALTWEHLRVSCFLAVFSGFYYSVVSITDATLREGLRDTAQDAVREACAARLVALHSFPKVS